MSGDHHPSRPPNRLAAETSPYLLQHAHNPVDWYPWGPEALTQARAEGKPIFLSIGYAACHWCHVMERESFEDEATAEDLRRGFISIKVDREERPDLDAIYMDAVQAMTGHGGWPMSVFLTPDGKPFYGGTYFPDERRHGMPSFREVLAAVRRAWEEDRESVEAAGERLVAAIDAGARASGEAAAAGTDPAPWMLQAAVAEMERTFDLRRGGWGGAPKFPQPMAVEALLRIHSRSGDPRPLAIARRTLDAMADGGIHDQLGGGFARYATDAAWLVPHFEKMLYDNAQLARAYVHAWQVTGAPRYRDVANSTLEAMVRDLRVEGSGFASSLDADTDGVEGATYVWDADEVERVLGPRAERFMAAYGVTPSGNWEGRTILSRVRSAAELAASSGDAPDAIEAELEAARRSLLEVRDRRPQPRRDDKVLAAWNGLALAALAEAGQTLGERRWIDVAAEVADRLMVQLRGPDGRWRRSWKDGRASAEAVLEDHAHLAEGFLALYTACFDERWFTGAVELADLVLDHFADPRGGFFDTADDAERLVARPKGLQDNAVPSGNAMATTVLLRLAALTGEGRYRSAAERALRQVSGVAHRYPTAFAQWLVASDLAIGPIDEVAIVAAMDDPDGRALLEVATAGFRPRQVLAVSGDPSASRVPLLEGRTRVEGRATAYVCRAMVCRRPVTDPAGLSAELRSSGMTAVE